MWIVFYVILQVSLGRTEREYFLQPNASSWEAARQHCRVCYKELATVTADNALHLLEKLDNSSLAVWVGLRRMLNETIASLSNATNNTESTQHLESRWFSGTPPWVQVSNSTNETFDGNSTWFSFFEGKLPWSRWSNGDPVTFQNWYPRRPVEKPKPEPIKCEPNTGTNISPTTPHPPSTTDSSFTIDGSSTTGTPRQNVTNSTKDLRNETSMCPQLEKLLQCIDDSEARDALSRSLTTPSLYQNSSNTTVSPNTATISIPSNTVSASPVNISTSMSAQSTLAPSTISTTDTPPSTIPPPTATPCPTITDSREEDLNKFIEDACLVLLSFGLWWERACSEVLPYICYDDRFYGELNVPNITYSSAILKWLEAPGEISGYRVEVESKESNWTHTSLTTNLTTELKNLTAGTKYTIFVYPIKCGRDLNPQIKYFFTQPDQIRNLSLSDVRETSVTLIWHQPEGGSDFYRMCLYNSSHRVNCVNVTKSQLTVNDTIAEEKYTVNNLTAGGEYTVEVSAEVADMSIPGRRFNQTFFTKPNKVKELAYHQPSTSSFQLVWKEPEGFASTYRVLVKNESVLYNESLAVTSFTAHNLVPGSEFDVTVWAQVNGSLEGEPETIQGFTKPSHVRDLTLNSTADTIKVSWTNPVGDYLNFSVKLYDPEKEVKSKIINDSQQLFQGLKAGANYTVEVQVFGVGELKSIFKYKSIFTLPNKPRNLEVENKGKTEISLKWDVPLESEGVTIQYNVFYISTFWKESNKTDTTNTSVTLKHLRPGTTYNFYVGVSAGEQNSENVTVTGETEPNQRNISLSLLCASMELLKCQQETTQNKLLLALGEHFNKTLSGVFFKLDWNDEKLDSNRM